MFYDFILLFGGQENQFWYNNTWKVVNCLSIRHYYIFSGGQFVANEREISFFISSAHYTHTQTLFIAIISGTSLFWIVFVDRQLERIECEVIRLAMLCLAYASAVCMLNPFALALETHVSDGVGLHHFFTEHTHTNANTVGTVEHIQTDRHTHTHTLASFWKWTNGPLHQNNVSLQKNFWHSAIKA